MTAPMPDWAKLLCCPIDRQPLVLSEDGAWLENCTGGRRYPIENGIAMLLPEHAVPLTGTLPDAETHHG